MSQKEITTVSFSPSGVLNVQRMRVGMDITQHTKCKSVSEFETDIKQLQHLCDQWISLLSLN